MTQFAKMEICFDDETAFAEAVDTMTKRIPVIAVRPEFTSGRADDKSLQNRLAETRPGFLMPRGGTLEIDFYACGANADTASGALPATHWGYHLLKDAFGGGDATEVGGTASGGSTATSLAFSGATLVRGGIIRVGKKKDGRADGQAARIGATTTTPASLLTALPAAPNAADVIRACLLVYPTETLGTSKRFLISWGQSGQQYIARGCHAERPVLRITHGGEPMWTIRYQVAWWEEVSGITFPIGLTLENCNWAVSAGGSYFLEAVGTTTRAVSDTVTLEIAFPGMGLRAKTTQGGRSLQPITGFERLKDAEGPWGTLSIAIPASEAERLEYDADGSDSVEKHFLATFSAGDGNASGEGRHLSMYCPRMYYIGARPTFTNWNGLLYTPVMFGLREGTDTTNDLTRAPVMFGMS